MSPSVAAVLFLDAELYLERVGGRPPWGRLQEWRAIPPAVAVFLSDGGAAARHEDFVCRPEYARFVACDLVDSVREEHRGVTEIVIAGLSLSGLAAACAATRHPAVFRAAVCQSPSFWWERGGSPSEPSRSSGSVWGAERPRPSCRTRRQGCGRG